MAPRREQLPAYRRLLLSRENFLEEVTNYCLLGCTDKELGAFFGLSENQVRAWAGLNPSDEDKYTIPDFAYAVNEGRDLADARVARAMFKRAEGYQYESNRLIIQKGHAEVHTVTEHVPPDTNAGKFWLTNRAKRKWKDRQQLSHVGADDGSPIQTEMTINFIAPTPPGQITQQDRDGALDGVVKVIRPLPADEPANDVD